MTATTVPLKLLLLEDNPADAVLLLRELKRASFAPEHVVCDTEDQFLANLKPDLDVVISDYNMPRFSAPRALELLLASKFEIPLIVVSGSVGEEVAADMIKRGAVDYLLKDRLARLGPAIRQACEGRRLRADRSRMEEQLRQSQKMQAIGQLASGIAHDFNNILTVILGYSDMLLAAEDAQETRGMAVEIRDAGQRAAAMTRQLLTFARKQVLEPRVVSLNEIIQATTNMLRRLLGGHIQLTAELEHATPLVRADPTQLEQVVINLVVNARDAMPRGGRMLLQTKSVELRAEQCDEGMQPGPYAALMVSDTGCGMSAETVARIFEPFFTTKGPGKGTGLGLATTYAVVTQAGGAVRVESTLGVGSCFTILLPAAGAPQPVALPVPASVSTAPGDKRVLVVEQDESVRNIVRLALTSKGYEVLEASSAAAAQAMTGLEGLHLVITDVALEDMSGPDLASFLEKRAPDLQVLYILGSNSGSLQEGLPEEAAYLQKPFAPPALLAEVYKLVGGQSKIS